MQSCQIFNYDSLKIAQNVKRFTRLFEDGKQPKSLQQCKFVAFYEF